MKPYARPRALHRPEGHRPDATSNRLAKRARRRQDRRDLRTDGQGTSESSDPGEPLGDEESPSPYGGGERAVSGVA